jgi:hypothetical protein
VGSINRSTGSAALIVWLCSIGVFIYYAVGVAGEFRKSASYSETINLKPVKNNTFYLKLNDLKYFTAEDSSRMHLKELSPNIKVTDDDNNDFEGFNYRNIHLEIQTSDSDQPVLIKTYRSRGPFYEAAFANARDIKYEFSQQDSVLRFDPRFYGKSEQPWHAEEVQLTLKLPKNTKVVIDHEIDRICGVNIYDCNELNKLDPNKVTNATFVMTDNGLQCKVDTLVTDTIIRKHLPVDSSKIKVK